MLVSIALLAVAGLCAIEAAYVRRGLPLPPGEEKDFEGLAKSGDLLVLGDSRADAGVDAKTLGDILGYPRAVNIAQPSGSPIRQLRRLALIEAHPACLLVVVSPASIYGIFYDVEPKAHKKRAGAKDGSPVRNVVEYPFDHSEKALSSAMRSHFHLSWGFKGLKALRRGQVPQCWDSRGWNRVSPLGEKRTFVSLVNVEAYPKVLKDGVGKQAVRDRLFCEAFRACGAIPGPAVLLRMPCSAELRKIEDRYYPRFDARMERVAKELGAIYLPDVPGFTPDWSESDGSHLLAPQAQEYSRILARQILRPIPVGKGNRALPSLRDMLSQAVRRPRG
jgi:hypothetical protein